MTLEQAEVPDRRLGAETLGPVTPANRPLYLVVIVILGVALLAGVVGWLILAANALSMPDGLSVILGTVAGALVALVSDPAKR